MNIEQERTEFEAWGRTMMGWSGRRDKFGDYVCEAEEFSWRAWKAGRASLQSQDREGYAGVTVWVDRLQCTKIITRLQYEGSNADELLRHFEAARAAIEHARSIERG